MFRFNFNEKFGEGDGERECTSDRLPAREHEVSTLSLNRQRLLTEASLNELAGGVCLRLFSADHVLAGRLGAPPPALLVEAACAHSDLLAGRYEGGLRVWQGCWDLVRAMVDGYVTVSGCRVAELGCGAAIPGLWTLQRGACSLLLQDYNPEVVDTLTAAHVLINTSDDQRSRCSLFSGDWGALASKWRHSRAHSVDLILSAETIYSVSSSERLIEAIDALLSHSGHCLLAAKTFYFGVGGGTRQFEQLLLRRGGFLCQSLFATESGLQQEVLLITREPNLTIHS